MLVHTSYSLHCASATLHKVEAELASQHCLIFKLLPLFSFLLLLLLPFLLLLLLHSICMHMASCTVPKHITIYCSAAAAGSDLENAKDSVRLDSHARAKPCNVKTWYKE